MSQNIIYIPTIQNEYKTGLIFAFIEGLKGGQTLKVVCENKPEELENYLKQAAIANVQWVISKANNNTWQLEIAKSPAIDSEHVGCCGMCGGHSEVNRG